MEGGGEEERMQEVAPDLNDTIEHDVDDEEQQQQEAAEEDEPQHLVDDDEQNASFQNGGSAKDAMIESDAKDSPDGSAGKSSSSGLVASGPSSSLSSSLVLERACVVLGVPGFACREIVWSLASFMCS